MKTKSEKMPILTVAAMFLLAVIVMFSSCGEQEEAAKPVENTETQQEKVIDDELPEEEEQAAPAPAEPAPENEQAQTKQEEYVPPEDAEGLYATFNKSLFIGDSRTEGFKLYSGVKNAEFFCAKSMNIKRVVDGEKLKFNGGSYSVYEVLDSGSYDKVYISLGFNELGWTYIDKFISEYKTLIGEIKTRQPNATIYVEALLPVTAAKSESHKTDNNSQINRYNGNLAQMAADTGCIYIDASAPLTDETGALKEDATTDGVHMNSKYCRIWAEYLAQIS